MGKLVISKNQVARNAKPSLSCKVEIKDKYLVVHYLNGRTHRFKQENIKRLVKWLIKEKFV